uniref:Nuclear envelope phosphatase-regulatory subunit 1 n=1 Tax=Lepisosteus oculatus TaxID=7918 RepID=W5MKX1_LEPOC
MRNNGLGEIFNLHSPDMFSEAVSESPSCFSKNSFEFFKLNLFLSFSCVLQVSFFTSLWNHPFFTISCITLIGLFFAGIHKRVVAPSIIAARCRTVLAEYNMSCDDTGKLILKPRPHVQ